MTNRILLVDDEPDTLTAFSRLLRRLDCEVDAAESFDEAEKAIENADYRVIVSDLRLTVATGEEGLDVLRQARRKNPTTAVIIITGYGCPSAMSTAFALGASYYFEKPVHPTQFMAAVEALCR